MAKLLSQEEFMKRLKEKRWVDYINFEKKLIIEWDEKYHLREKKKMKDITREKEIKELFPDFKFVRIQEWRVVPSLEL
jgi:very-short-patch-repair endonuclease